LLGLLAGLSNGVLPRIFLQTIVKFNPTLLFSVELHRFIYTSDRLSASDLGITAEREKIVGLEIAAGSVGFAQ
jgi:hypothetical protein